MYTRFLWSLRLPLSTDSVCHRRGPCCAARLAGLVQIKVTNCTGDPRDTVFADTTWDVYIYPLVIYALYYMLAYESRILGTLRVGTAAAHCSFELVMSAPVLPPWFSCGHDM